MAVYWSPTAEVDDDWREHAACRQTDANLFFPAGNTGAAVDQIETAKTFCRSCPVQYACLRYALQTNQGDGVWGGKDEAERRRLRREWEQGRQLPQRSVRL